MPHSDQSNDGLSVLHRASFIDWQPSPIVAIASSDDGSLAVVARDNGELELYETSTLHRVQRIPGNINAAPTCLAIVEENNTSRIFSSGLDGTITEYDAENLRVAASTDSYGGAVWQLALEPRAPVDPAPTAGAGGNGSNSAPLRLAAACDDGCVRLFNIEPGTPGVIYSKTLPRVEGRILAVAWHPSGKFIATAGTDACIRIWDVATNREVVRITAGDASGKELCVWSLLYLPDGVLVSGDSNGNVCFWEGKFGTLIQRFSQHKADVLQLAASPGGFTVFASGVDPQIAVFRKLQSEPAAQQKWAFLSAKRPHTHDVRAMCTVQGKHATSGMLWTGGNDTLIMAHSVDGFLKEHPRKVESCPQRPLIQALDSSSPSEQQISNKKGKKQQQQQQQQQDDGGQPPRLLCMQRDHVDLWQLATPSSSHIAPNAAQHANEGELLAPADQPWHLARVSNRSGRHFVAAAAASDGSLLAVSDSHRMLCFALQEARNPEQDSENEEDLRPIEAPPHLIVTHVELPADLPAATHVAFRPGHPQVIACAADGTLRLLQISNLNPEGTGSDSGAEGAAPSAEVVHVIRDVHDLRYKMWHKRDRSRNAARRALPAIEALTVSGDGSWLAVLVHGRAHLLSLESCHLVAQMPPLQDHAPVAALTFTSDGASLVVVGAGNELAVFSVPDGQPTEWTVAHSAPGSLPKRLTELPGPVLGLATNPGANEAVMIYSSAAVCHINFSKPVPTEPKNKKRRREREVRMATPAGQNCRALYCNEPVLHVQFLDNRSLLVVERSWNEVWKGLAPPMYRHRYGT